MISAVFRRGGDVTFVVEELKAVFDELTYGKLAEGDQQLQASTEEVLKRVPHGIYTG